MFAVNSLSHRAASRRKSGNAYEVQMSLGHGTLEMVKPYLSLADADLKSTQSVHHRWRKGGCGAGWVWVAHPSELMRPLCE